MSLVGIVLTPDEWHPSDRLGQLEAYLPDICRLAGPSNAQELLQIALSIVCCLSHLLLSILDS